jgi:maleylacetate reductase
MRRIASALGTEDAAAGLFELAKRLGAPTSLAAIGMKADGIDKAADLAVKNPYWNPEPVERGAVRRLIDDAFHGRAPGSGRLA